MVAINGEYRQFDGSHGVIAPGCVVLDGCTTGIAPGEGTTISVFVGSRSVAAATGGTGVMQVGDFIFPHPGSHIVQCKARRVRQVWPLRHMVTCHGQSVAGQCKLNGYGRDGACETTIAAGR